MSGRLWRRLLIAGWALAAAGCAAAPASSEITATPARNTASVTPAPATTATASPTATPAVPPTPAIDLTLIAPQVPPSVRRDVEAAVRAAAPGICAALLIPCDFPVMVEIYPDQTAFDRAVMNPEMRGFFAASGDGRIQMVSPANVSSRDLTYEEAAGIAAHEFAHLALDRIAADLPDWLEEGTAVYLGPHEVYAAARGEPTLLAMAPSFARLRDEYDDVTAADFFAFTAVEYLVLTYGLDALNALLRDPVDLEGALGVSAEEFGAAWRAAIGAP